MGRTRNTQAPARATVREWTGLAVIALPCMLYSMDLTVLNLAIPAISEDLKPTASQLLWIVDIYGFFVAGLLVTMGTLGDRIGRRRLLLIGAAAFGVASVLAAFSTSANMLIATRALLGVAGATLAPSTLSLIRNMFLDPAQRTVAIGVWISSYSAGAVIGPVLGGVLLQYFAWGSVFLIGVPVMVLLLVLGPMLLPEYRDPDAARLDLASVALSLGAVLPVIYGVKQIAEHGLHPVALLSMVLGLVLGALFVRRQKRLANPMIDLGLFGLPAFTVSLGAYMLACFVMFGIFLYNAQYLQLVLGLSPLHAGLWSMPSAGGFIVGSLMVPALARRMRPAFVMGGGLAVAALGFGMLVLLPGPHAQGGLAWMVMSAVVSSLGLAPVFTLATDLVVGSAPPERAGVASAISETSSEFGGALGIAILGSIGAAIYRTAMADAVPAGLAGAAEVDAARSTLGGAVALAAQVGGSAGAELVEAGREALLSGLRLTSGICAAVLLFVGALVAVRLRGAGAQAAPAANPGAAALPER
ncbi:MULTISPECIES: MFS transporter [unclassified Variovorax]|uniref:MFS transporter n=1 Tax=unclassified Variovorax TaxID=663243 RepID=UPI0008CADE57|nr:MULTISPECIES: MFS transporter [unclassified Variovorax]SEK16387.1 MFS transporter, DHA2 family, multidrug resistance protein [Variovorax sp. OK202]SFE46317.1 MFS transporter, DHA2 family, multidrug resistance protein [Variovorax sp. OK212]